MMKLRLWASLPVLLLAASGTGHLAESQFRSFKMEESCPQSLSFESDDTVAQMEMGLYKLIDLPTEHNAGKPIYSWTGDPEGPKPLLFYYPKSTQWRIGYDHTLSDAVLTQAGNGMDMACPTEVKTWWLEFTHDQRRLVTMNVTVFQGGGDVADDRRRAQDHSPTTCELAPHAESPQPFYIMMISAFLKNLGTCIVFKLDFLKPAQELREEWSRNDFKSQLKRLVGICFQLLFALMAINTACRDFMKIQRFAICADSWWSIYTRYVVVIGTSTNCVAACASAVPLLDMKQASGGTSLRDPRPEELFSADEEEGDDPNGARDGGGRANHGVLVEEGEFRPIVEDQPNEASPAWTEAVERGQEVGPSTLFGVFVHSIAGPAFVGIAFQIAVRVYQWEGKSPCDIFYTAYYKTVRERTIADYMHYLETVLNDASTSAMGSISKAIDALWALL